MTRAWTRVYTVGLSHADAERRRNEIDSDLWELTHDPDGDRGVSSAAQIAMRLATGIVDDLRWRLDRMQFPETPAARRVAATVVAFALAGAVMWLTPLSSPVRGQVGACAEGLQPASTRADLRAQVIRCAGAFFAAPRMAGRN
jgi:hypothetical protein